MTKKVVVLGSGEMAAAMAFDLLRAEDVGSIVLADLDGKRWHRICRRWRDKRSA